MSATVHDPETRSVSVPELLLIMMYYEFNIFNFLKRKGEEKYKKRTLELCPPKTT
jgi:hypothetical protein